MPPWVGSSQVTCECDPIRTELLGIDGAGQIHRFRFNDPFSASYDTPGDSPSDVANGLAVGVDEAFWVNGFGLDRVIRFHPFSGALLPGGFPRTAPGTPHVTHGLGLVTTELLASFNFADQFLFRLHTPTNTIQGGFPLHQVWGDMAGGNGRLFAFRQGNRDLAEYDPTTGTELGRFPAPDLDGDGNSDDIVGLAFDGVHLFAASGDAAPPNIAALDPETGTVLGLSPFAAPSGSLTGLGAMADQPGPACDPAQAVLDDDADGLPNACDNCPNAENASQDDGDGDGFGDPCDNCPAEANLRQKDTDMDGVGDACDECELANPIHTAPFDCNGDGDTDDVGEAAGEQCASCAPVTFLIDSASASTEEVLVGGAADFPAGCGSEITTIRIRLRCGANTVEEASLGLIVGLGLDPNCVDFGGGCTATSCVGATKLGATVDPANSSAQGPGLASPRPDTVYFRASGGPLCTFGQVVDIAELEIAQPALQALPATTDDGLTELGFGGVVNDAGEVLPKDLVKVITGPDSPAVRLGLRPAPGDTSGTQYQVVLEAGGLLHSTTFGLVGFPGVTAADMSFGSCNIASGPGNLRTCPGGMSSSSLGPTVDPNQTFTVGPDSTSPVLFVTAVGKIPRGTDLPSLNALVSPGETSATLLGVVQFVFNGVDPVTPGLTLQLIETVPNFQGAFVSNIQGFPPIPPGLAGLETQFTPSEDLDLDLISEEIDNCPFKANADQADDGGFLSNLEDLIGNKCQCGDGLLDGAVFAEDVRKMREFLAGLPVDVDGPDLYSVEGQPSVDILDVVIHQLATAGLGPGVGQNCFSAINTFQ